MQPCPPAARPRPCPPGPTPGQVNATQNRATVETVLPYFSRTWMIVERGGADPNFTYTLANGTEVFAFSYGKNQDMASAGNPGVNARPCDTNLLKAYTTLRGMQLTITGISCLVNPGSDFELARLGFPEISVAAGLTGDETQWQLGTPLFLPAPGGLQGWGNSEIAQPPFPDTNRFAFLGTNGAPVAGNFFSFRDAPIIWQPEGFPDSSFNIRYRVERDVVISSVARAAAAGVAAFAPPTEIKLDMVTILHGYAEGPQSVNS